MGSTGSGGGGGSGNRRSRTVTQTMVGGSTNYSITGADRNGNRMTVRRGGANVNGRPLVRRVTRTLRGGRR